MVETNGGNTPERRDGERIESIHLKTRIRHGVPEPGRIRLAVPGWAGSSTAHGNGAEPMPWHCQPFVDAATYGLELIYPYQNECFVYNNDGQPGFEVGIALQDELAKYGKKSPFSSLSAQFYGMGTWLDLLPPPGYSLRLEAHPRFFTSQVDDVPIAVPGHLQEFWPRQFFAIFKTPSPGHVHAFRPGQPYAQLLVVPTRVSISIDPMDEGLSRTRFEDDAKIEKYRYLMVKHLWKSNVGVYFDDLYKQLSRIFRKGGAEAVHRHLRAAEKRVRSIAKPE